MDTISTFARRVGLTPSALRFYDDCGVLRPARVDPGSGYRYYSSEQERDAALLRTLREAEFPLADVPSVLTGPASQARDALTAHAHRLRDRAEAAHTAVRAALRLVSGERHVEVTIGGAELASAIRQVHPAAARSGTVAALGCVLVECSPEAVRLAATDRYRLAVRDLVPQAVVGTPSHVLVPVAPLVEAAGWAVRHPVVRLVAGDEGLRLFAGEARAAGDVVDLPVCDDDYPDYRAVLDALGGAHSRVVTDRTALYDALSAADGTVVVTTGRDTLHVGDVVVPAVCSEPIRLAFDPAVLAPVVAAGVGPDVLLEITAPDRPVIVRSADQGSFTTLVMPVHAESD
ncbi:MerR family transcriptional regulator [Saccharomonospora piscinae]|uniref:DNA polymerase III subunit beta family protein n=1 Tax=Saccharomonospora piscinae TaxID=687388 RepID=UPI0004665B25|nr:MerR family transcriptional regulator [Saccharomonospora piscinae]